MLASQRKGYLLRILAETGQVVAKSVSHDLGLSEDTIRRDLRELAGEGRLQRVHGGALPSSPATVDLSGRQRIGSAAKAAIGRAAAMMVRSGQIIFLDGGTTTFQLAKHLPLDLQATIVTHSPTIAMALADHSALEVILIGGRLFKHSMVTVGSSATETIARFRADVYFMGVTGIHPQAGFSTGDLEESYVKRAFIASAAETYVMVSAEKLNTASAYVIGALDAVDGIIVERGIPNHALAVYRKAGLTVHRA